MHRFGLVLWFALLGLAACDLDLSSHATNNNTINIRILPAGTPAEGCSAIALGAERVEGENAVTLSIASEAVGPFLLSINGATYGPVTTGAVVPVTLGANRLQVSSGACVSNPVVVEVS